MKKFLKIIGFIFLGFIAFGIIGALLSDDDTTSTATAEATTSAETDNEPDLTPEEKAKALDLTKQKLEAVKKSFNFEKDEFTNAGWYTHKIWDKAQSKPCLKVFVNEKGYLYMQSFYTSDDWLFHDHVSAKVDDVVLSSEVVSTFSDDNVRDNSGGTIWEYVSYTGGKDNGIIDLIAKNPDKAVKIRYHGKDYYNDITLTKTQVLAIGEAKRLSDLIKQVNQGEY